MKVVLFCGGQGLRLRDFSDTIPKPMVPVGFRPIMWHLMKYYAHFGHKDFILCLGHKAEAIQHYFLRYECVTDDETLPDGSRKITLHSSDIPDWTITFVDTGLDSNIGQRLVAVKEHLRNEPVFLANYSDNLTDAAMPDLIAHFEKQNKIASFLSVRPSHTFHVVRSDAASLVQDILPVTKCDVWINGGFFVFKQEIFDHIHLGEELVIEPFKRLIAKGELTTYRHEGFWACMDTFKEKRLLEDFQARGNPPWEVWSKRRETA